MTPRCWNMLLGATRLTERAWSVWNLPWLR
jgi:hypothetical protein